MNGNYTKHIYIGSQRIVSKLGDLDSYGSDPRRIEYAGANVDGAKVDYADKYKALQQTIKDRYAKFEVPYYGKDNDDYVNGQGFCCDNTPNLKSFNPSQNDNPELFQYYYHSDHLGSSSLITNLDGETVQHIEYVPFGEVFIEERNNTWNTPYLFNAKELDEETGLYYYGARYYDPRVSIWLSADPLQEKYPNISTYAYTFQNPVRYEDIKGLYPKPILQYYPSRGNQPEYYKFTEPAVRLLSLVSGIPEVFIKNTKVWERAPGRYMPFYRSDKGGGAITIGSTSIDSKIIFTQNFFKDDRTAYDNHGYGQDFYAWMGLSSHEVGHLKHIGEHNNIFTYFASFGIEYAKYGHDNSPREKEADKGYKTFREFDRFIDNNYGTNALKNLFESDKRDYQKIETINKWWDKYLESKNPKKDPIKELFKIK